MNFKLLIFVGIHGNSNYILLKHSPSVDIAVRIIVVNVYQYPTVYY